MGREHEIFNKDLDRRIALYKEMEREGLTRDEQDAQVLEDILLSIRAYSPWWRMGYRAVLKRAIARIGQKEGN